MSELLDKIYGHKVIALYRCGSKGWGVDGEDSDEDYTAILEDYHSVNIYKEEKTDYFTFGKETLKEALTFSDSIPTFLEMWLDNILLAKNNMVYIEPEFEKEFDELIPKDWSKLIKPWLRKNLNYLQACLKLGINAKYLYNYYRLHSIVSNYEKTGKFEVFLSEEDKEKIIDYKIRKVNQEKHIANFKEINSYLENFLKEEQK